ncbi:TPA: hypothetical protein ACJEU7_002188 [Acinetobacter baumannii]|uniref:hypothetical protein n=1 Tax=Acinetobacter baumannii TaxID=470 RepID=UPI00224ED03C|nr:hypothetical protein [Acinetobacter baumannii]MCX3035223.1 hypothetical protein [Acinetobacter baumannii]
MNNWFLLILSDTIALLRFGGLIMATVKDDKPRKAKSALSKKKYEAEKRQTKPVSFNKVKEKEILNIATNINFSGWVKNILASLTQTEISILKSEENPTLVPALLVEKAIEEGLFSLEEYLESKGKKIVDITDNRQDHDDSCQFDSDYM